MTQIKTFKEKYPELWELKNILSPSGDSKNTNYTMLFQKHAYLEISKLLLKIEIIINKKIPKNKENQTTQDPSNLKQFKKAYRQIALENISKQNTKLIDILPENIFQEIKKLSENITTLLNNGGDHFKNEKSTLKNALHYPPSDIWKPYLHGGGNENLIKRLNQLDSDLGKKKQGSYKKFIELNLLEEFHSSNNTQSHRQKRIHTPNYIRKIGGQNNFEILIDWNIIPPEVKDKLLNDQEIDVEKSTKEEAEYKPSAYNKYFNKQYKKWQKKDKDKKEEKTEAINKQIKESTIASLDAIKKHLNANISIEDIYNEIADQLPDNHNKEDVLTIIKTYIENLQN